MAPPGSDSSRSSRGRNLPARGISLPRASIYPLLPRHFARSVVSRFGVITAADQINNPTTYPRIFTSPFAIAFASRSSGLAFVDSFARIEESRRWSSFARHAILQLVESGSLRTDRPVSSNDRAASRRRRFALPRVPSPDLRISDRQLLRVTCDRPSSVCRFSLITTLAIPGHGPIGTYPVALASNSFAISNANASPRFVVSFRFVGKR